MRFDNELKNAKGEIFAHKWLCDIIFGKSVLKSTSKLVKNITHGIINHERKRLYDLYSNVNKLSPQQFDF